MSINRGVIRNRESFISNISSRLGRKSVAASPPEHPFRGAPEWYKEIERTTDEHIQLFTSNWTALTGQVMVVEAKEAEEKIGEWLQQIAGELQVKQASRWEHAGLIALNVDKALTAAGVEVVPWALLPSSDQEAMSVNEAAPLSTNWSLRSKLLQRTERCELGIIWPDYAVANTSTLVLQCSPENGRSVSLLTDILFAVFRADQLVTRMGEAFEQITADKQDASQYPSSLNLVTGPSRSADIENDLTIGIHGPGKVYAVIIK